MFGAVTVWNLASRAKRLELRGHTDAILGAAVSADGTILATAGYDRQILLWSLAKGAVLRTLKEHTDAVLGVSFSPDGKVLASCSADRTVKLWDWHTGRRIATLSGASGELYACDLRRGGLSRAGRRRGSIDPGLACLRGPARPGAVGARARWAHRAAGSVARWQDACVQRRGPQGEALGSSISQAARRAAVADRLGPRSGLQLRRPAAGDRPVRRHDRAGRDRRGQNGSSSCRHRLTRNPRTAPVVAISRKATLDPPNPRGAVRGSKVRLTLSGQGVGQTTALVLPEPGLSATIVPAKSPDANRVQVDLEIAPDARVGVHALGVITPLGVPPLQSFAVSEFPEAAEAEPDDEPARGRLVTPSRHPGRHDPEARRSRSLSVRGPRRAGARLRDDRRGPRLQPRAGSHRAR